MSDAKEAPGKLRFVAEFVNTMDFDDDTEHLASPADLGAWLAARGLARPDLAVGQADLKRAIELREALRAALLANNGAEPLSEASLATINRAGERARLVPHFDGRGEASLEPVSDDVDGALGRLLTIVHDAMATGLWPRLKACRAESCRWAFFDQSKNHSRHWCSMESCGSQAKARSYRRRKAAAGTGSTPDPSAAAD